MDLTFWVSHECFAIMQHCDLVRQLIHLCLFHYIINFIFNLLWGLLLSYSLLSRLFLASNFVKGTNSFLICCELEFLNLSLPFPNSFIFFVSSRFMNQYFLLIACLQLWSLITPVNPASTWGPLIFIFAVSATKEAWDDYNRYLSDKKANEKEVWVVRKGTRKHV